MACTGPCYTDYTPQSTVAPTHTRSHATARRGTPSPDAISSGLEKFAEYRIPSPSLLDVQPLSERFDDPGFTNEVYVLSPLLDHPDYPTEILRLPIGAYVDGEWKLFVYPIP